MKLKNFTTKLISLTNDDNQEIDILYRGKGDISSVFVSSKNKIFVDIKNVFLHFTNIEYGSSSFSLDEGMYGEITAEIEKQIECSVKDFLLEDICLIFDKDRKSIVIEYNQEDAIYFAMEIADSYDVNYEFYYNVDYDGVVDIDEVAKDCAEYQEGLNLEPAINDIFKDYLSQELFEVRVSNEEKKWKEVYERYKKVTNNIKGIENNKFREITKIIKDCLNERKIPINVYHDLRNNETKRELLEQLSNFTLSYGFKLVVLRNHLIISPITEEGIFLMRWTRPRNRNHRDYIDYIVKSELYHDTISPLLIYDVKLSYSEFYERFKDKFNGEVDVVLNKINNTFVDLNEVYTSISESAKEFANNINICCEEVKKVWLELKERSGQIVIKQESGEIKLKPKFANIVNIKGETVVYSDHEGCANYVRYEGDIAIHLDMDGKVSCFDDISLNSYYEYDGGEEQLEGNILEYLRENYVFDLI